MIVTHDENLAAMADRKITMSDGLILGLRNGPVNMKKLLWLLLPALAAYGAWELVREVRGAWTSDYFRTYSRAVGQDDVPGVRFAEPLRTGRPHRGAGRGFRGFRTDRWTRGLHVAAWRDFTGGDETAFIDDATDHGTRVCTNLGGRSGDTIRGLAWGRGVLSCENRPRRSGASRRGAAADPRHRVAPGA